jgi:hypothetical protein
MEDESSALPRVGLNTIDAQLEHNILEPITPMTPTNPSARSKGESGPSIKGATSAVDINEGIKFLQKLLKGYDQ